MRQLSWVAGRELRFYARGDGDKRTGVVVEATAGSQVDSFHWREKKGPTGAILFCVIDGVADLWPGQHYLRWTIYTGTVRASD